STSDRMGQKPETAVPAGGASASTQFAKLRDASMRQRGSSASRRASASCRSVFFSSRGVTSMPPCSGTRKLRRSGKRHTQGKGATLAYGDPRQPMECSIPGTYKVGGRHMTKSTDKVRDSSLQDR